uniref:Uncharacterized protein n=1 Tax=Arundo donax TaxID=35708 RepID=A0A0A9FHE4_ARUDO
MNRLTALARKGCAASAPGSGPVDALFAAVQSTDRRRHDHHHQPPVVVKAKECAAASGRPAPWRPCLDRIDESIGRSSMRSASNRSVCSEA